MVSIVKTPETLSFAENPVLAEVSSTNNIITEGEASILNIEVNGVDSTAGHTFIILASGEEIVFTSAISPDDSGYQYPVATGSDTFSTWAEKIFAVLCENYLLAKDYLIILSGVGATSRGIVLTAKKNGIAYNLDFTAGTATGIGKVGAGAGKDTVYRENFVIVAGIWDLNMTLLAEEIKPIDGSGHAKFDFSEYLVSLLRDVSSSRFTWPEVVNVNWHIFTNYFLRFRISFAEKYDGIVRQLAFDSWRYAIGGGLDHETLMSLFGSDLTYFTDSNQTNRFLTWQPVEKTTGIAQPEKLFFFFQTADMVDYRGGVIVHYTDGTTYSFFLHGLSQIPIFQVIELCVGYSQLGLGNISPEKTVDYWNVKIVDGSGVDISETRKFILDEEYHENEHTFLFRNSFSTYDVIRFTGDRELSLEFERSTGVLISDEPISPYNAPQKQFSAVEEQKFKANSGYISLEMKNYLREFLLSNERYEVIDKFLYPISITNSKSSPFLKDNETLYDLEIEYQRSYTHTHFSNYKPGYPDTSSPVVIDEETILETGSDPIIADHILVDLVPAGYMLECLVFTNISTKPGQISAGTGLGLHNVFEQQGITETDYTTVKVFRVFSETEATSIYLNHICEGDSWNGMQLFVKATLRKMS